VDNHHRTLASEIIGGAIMDVQKAIETKRAVRLFKEDPIPDEVTRAILDAGRRSQSAKNTQPWQFVVVTDREKLQSLSKTGDYAGHLAGAAFGVALVGENEHNDFDLGQSAAYMQLAAWELGVGSCIASIYHPDQAKAIMGIPDEKYLRTMLSFGYPSPEHKPAQMGGRRPLDEVVHWGGW
jgi:nitroreductase